MPEKELFVREIVDKLTQNLKKNSINVLVIDLYEMWLELLENQISVDRIHDFEKKNGSDELLNQSFYIISMVNYT